MMCTTIRPRATNWDRPFPSRASTTLRTIGSFPISSATTSTTPAPARAHAERVGRLCEVAGRHFNRGQRAFFFARGYLGLFVSPWLLMATSIGVAVVLWRGNTVNLSHQRVLQLVSDSLRYWVQEMHVDGFRFDLGTILAREPYGFDEGGGFLDACRQDPILASVKLIAEPWDCGPGGYQVGKFPPGWAEWNDRYRDTVRAFWKGDEGTLAEFAGRITG